MTEPKLPSPPEGHRWVKATGQEYISSGASFSMTTWNDNVLSAAEYYISKPLTVRIAVDLPVKCAQDPGLLGRLRGPMLNQALASATAALADAIERHQQEAS